MTDSLERTAWLPGTTTPVRTGVYERRVSDGAFSCWDGTVWNKDADDPATAAEQTVASRDQNASWRGCIEASDRPCGTCKGHTVVDDGYDEETAQDRIVECPDC